MSTSWSDTQSRLQDHIFCISNFQFLFLFFFAHSFIFILFYFCSQRISCTRYRSPHSLTPNFPQVPPNRFRSLPPPLILSITQQVHLLHPFVWVSGHLLEMVQLSRVLFPLKSSPPSHNSYQLLLSSQMGMGPQQLRPCLCRNLGWLDSTKVLSRYPQML